MGATLGFGILFFYLHTLPERMAHRSHKLQFEIVAVLGLLALFTHVHLFWVAGLLLALIDIPDFGGWLGRIATAVERGSEDIAVNVKKANVGACNVTLRPPGPKIIRSTPRKLFNTIDPERTRSVHGTTRLF